MLYVDGIVLACSRAVRLQPRQLHGHPQPPAGVRRGAHGCDHHAVCGCGCAVHAGADMAQDAHVGPTAGLWFPGVAVAVVVVGRVFAVGTPAGLQTHAIRLPLIHRRRPFLGGSCLGIVVCGLTAVRYEGARIVSRRITRYCWYLCLLYVWRGGRVVGALCTLALTWHRTRTCCRSPVTIPGLLLSGHW